VNDHYTRATGQRSKSSISSPPSRQAALRGNTLITVLLKNALQPAIALGICMLIHLNIEQTRYVTLKFRRPQRSPCYFVQELPG